MEAAAFLRAPAVLRLWRATLIAGLIVLGLHYVAHYSDGGPRLYETWFYEGLELLAALGCIARAVFIRAERSAWFFIGGALLATTCGDILYDFWYGGSPPFPSGADVAYLAFYPLLYVGIVLVIRRRLSTFSASLWLDGLMAATVAGALGSVVLVDAVVKSTHGSPLVVVTNLAYPIGDVLLLALVVFVFSVMRWQPGRAWALIAAGLLLNTIGDAVYLYQTAVGSYVEGTYLDLVWPVSLVLVALAAWQRPGRVPRIELHSRALLGTPFVCGLTATGLLVAASQVQVHPIALFLASATIVLVLARTALTFWENAQLLEASRERLSPMRSPGWPTGASSSSTSRPSSSALTAASSGCSRCSTSTASRPTTTPSAIPPETPCSADSRGTSPRPWRRAALRTGWAATSSVCCCRLRSRSCTAPARLCARAVRDSA
jgi:hypothetical protein